MAPHFKNIPSVDGELHLFVVMLQIRRVNKSYYGKLIIGIDDFTFDKGIHWISGVNGSGKTTLLKMVCAMIPFEGDIVLNGISAKRQPVAYRRIVSFAEAEPLYPSFITGIDLVKYYQKIKKASSHNVDELIDFSGLHNQLNAAIGTYSSGMVKRLSLLLAFIGQVPLILLDEPLSTLDIEAVHALPDLINRYHDQYGTSFILSSHQPLPDGLEADHRYIITNQTIHLPDGH